MRLLSRGNYSYADIPTRQRFVMPTPSRPHRSITIPSYGLTRSEQDELFDCKGWELELLYYSQGGITMQFRPIEQKKTDDEEKK